MKTSAIVRIVLCSIAILVLLSLLVGGLLLNTFIMDTDWSSIHNMLSIENTGTLASAGEVSAAEIRDIQIEWASGSITIVPGDTDVITFSETADLPDSDKMVWSQTGDKLTIQFTRTQVFFGTSIQRSKDLVITVPRDWTCDDLEIDSASARVEITDLTINNVDFDGASGICDFDNCNVGHLDLDTASGNVRFSGTLTELDCDAASASCTIRLQNSPSRIDADMVSGDLDLALPEDCGFTVSLDALSGDFSSDFATTRQDDYYIYGNGSCRISISALSGDVTIRNANESASE